MHTICKCLGGSHSYSLNTPESDTDIRGVFLNTDVSYILKLNSEDHQTKINSEEDTQFYELRRFVELLRKGNTGALEILFNKNWIEIDPKFQSVFLDNGMHFVSSHKLFSCLRGYGQSEHRLALGLRPGIIGHKRAEQVRKYGYSPKNFTQLIRLMHVGIEFFSSGRFIVDCREFEPEVYKLLMKLKTEPGTYTAEWATSLYKDLDKQLEQAHENRGEDFVFDEAYAVEALLSFYYPPIHEAHSKLKL